MWVRNMVKIAAVFLLLTIERNVTGQKESMRYIWCCDMVNDSESTPKNRLTFNPDTHGVIIEENRSI